MVERTPVCFPQGADRVPPDQPAIDDDLRPTLRRHVGPQELQHFGVDAVGADQHVAGRLAAVFEGCSDRIGRLRRRSVVCACAHGCGTAPCVDRNRRPLIEAHQQDQPVM